MKFRQENQNSFEINLGCDIILRSHDEYVWGQRSISGHMWPSEVTMNMHEVRGWDMTKLVKTQLMSQYDITPELISSYFDFHWLGATAFLLSSQKQPLSHYWLSHISDLFFQLVICYKLVLKSVSYPKILKNTPILI